MALNSSPRSVAEKVGYQLVSTEKGNENYPGTTYVYNHPISGESLLIDVTPTGNSHSPYSYDWSHHSPEGKVLGTGRDGEDLRRYLLRKFEKELRELEVQVEDFPEDSEAIPETKCPSCKRFAKLDSEGFCDQC